MALGLQETSNHEHHQEQLDGAKAVIDINKDLSALFIQQANATPGAVALEDPDVRLTYAELDRKVTVLAQRLRNYGVTRDSLVGVLFGRSADYVVACLAVLRAGGAFLVLELAYPPDLLAEVIEDAKPAAVITHTAQATNVKAKIPLILLDQVDSEADGPLGFNGEDSSYSSPDDDLGRLAFVCYTSGTTGRPKGILNPHRAAVHSYDMRFRLNDVHPGDRIACNAFFIWEMLRPLLRGATTFCVPDEASYDPVSLVDLLSSRNITETLMTPTLLATVLARHSSIETRLPALRTLWLNGEVVTTDLARRAIKALPMTRILNCYSASETHEIACGDVRAMLNHNASYVPVGPPMDPEHTYVLSESGERVGTGINGELFVGSFLARGYLNLPDVTEKAFKPDPFDNTPGARMYRTGDEARMLPSGLLEITGRTGGMLKVRGYSVVPGKVENAIHDQLAVSHCAVISHGEGLERQLVAYFVRDTVDPGDRTVPELSESGYSPVARRALSKVLPQYMIPSLWVELPAIPTHHVSGKVDVKSLPPPGNGAKSGTATPDRDVSIKLQDIVEIWAAAMKTSPSDITEDLDFFDLGGHSLALAEVANRLSKKFGFSVPVQNLAGNPTLEGHLAAVRAARDGHTAAVQADLPKVLRADSVLPPDIHVTGAAMCPLSEADTIFLTGATGFLGGFLLSDLISSTSARIVCLTRSIDSSKDDRAAGIAILRRNLLDLGLWNDSIMDRVEILPGNLSRRQLGLSPEAFEELASRVQVVVHAAATVNLVYPYAALRGANVGGTREVVRLACRAGATLQYISTNGVLPPSNTGWPEHAMIDVDDVPEKVRDGYGQTKFVAEQLVYEAGRRGLPTRVYRLGTLSGHSTSGSTNARDLLSALVVESLQLGYAPDIQGWRAEMTPVDFVSKAIIHLSNDTRTFQRVFHLGDSNPIDTKLLFDDLDKLGYGTQRLSWDEWVALWTEKRGSAKGGDGAFTIDILRGGKQMSDILLLSRYSSRSRYADCRLLEVSDRTRRRCDKALARQNRAPQS